MPSFDMLPQRPKARRTSAKHPHLWAKKQSLRVQVVPSLQSWVRYLQGWHRQWRSVERSGWDGQPAPGLS